MSVLAPLGPTSQLPLQLSQLPLGSFDTVDSFAVSISGPRPAVPSFSPKRFTPAPLRLASSAAPEPTGTTTITSTRTRTSTITATSTIPHSRAVSVSARPRDISSPQVHARYASASTPHTNTMSTLSMQRQPTNSSTVSTLPRRSTSGRSATSTSPTSYVALMRKQKATVWCDRSQSIEPHTAAARKIAKERALAKISNGVGANSGSGRTATLSSSGVVGKIRHGGVPKAPGYVASNMSGAGVPMRLSANEMLGDEEEERSFISGDNSMVHARSSSGKSSTSSAKYRSGYPRPEQARFSGGTSPIGPDTGSPASRDRIAEESTASAHTPQGQTPHTVDEECYGELKDLAAPRSLETRTDQIKKADDLRRRGSVDERAMTMGSSVKLFVANPDIDSD